MQERLICRLLFFLKNLIEVGEFMCYLYVSLCFYVCISMFLSLCLCYLYVVFFFEYIYLAFIFLSESFVSSIINVA